MITHGVRKKVLNNGLTVLVKEKHDAPVIAIFTYVKAGYFNEPDRLVGISHLIEHMFFKGTARRGVAQIAKETKMLGGYVNASTIYDHTLYFTVLPRKSFSEGLDIQADALINSVFEPEELRKETEVVIQEAKRKLDIPSAVAREKMFELAFDKHRMRRWRIGAEEGLRALTRSDFLIFHQNLYRPENIILVIVGDIDHDDAFKQAQKYYGNFEKGSLVKEESPAEPPQQDFKYRQIRGDIQHSHLDIGFHTPELFHPDSYAVEILAFVLGQGRSSRLYQRVKQELNLVQTLSVSNYELQDLGLFMIEAIAEPEKVELAEQAIFEQIAKIKATPVEEAELTKSQNILEAQYLSSLQSASGQASILAAYEAYGDYRLADEYLKNLYQVSDQNVLEVANKYLTIDNCSLLEYVPKSSEEKPSNSATKERELGEILQAAPDKFEHGSRSHRSVEVFEFLSTHTSKKEIERHVLPKGITLLIKENHLLPLVSAGFFVKGGKALENRSHAGITGLTLRTALKGTQNRTANQIAFEIENLGSSIHYANDPDYFSYSMTILSKNFEAGIDILTDVMLHPTFPEQELQKEKNNTLNAILQEKDDMFRYPIKLFYSTLFGEHPYGLPAYGYPEFVSNCTKQDLSSWHANFLNPRNLTVVIVGDIESHKAQDFIARKFEELANNDNFIAKPRSMPKLNKIEETVEVREKAQTALALGFLGPKYTEPEYYALSVLQNAISGLGGRFFEELRGKQSLAYSVTAFLVSQLYGGAFVSYIATSPEQEDDARQGLLKEYQKLIREPITEEELKQAIQYTVGTYQIGLETIRSKMFQYAHYELMGKGLEEMHRFPQHIEKVTSEDILLAAKKYFDLERFASGVVRGK